MDDKPLIDYELTPQQEQNLLIWLRLHVAAQQERNLALYGQPTVPAPRDADPAPEADHG